MSRRRKHRPQEEPEFDWDGGALGKELRDEGMERVLAGEPAWWKANYYRILGEQPAELKEPFKGEDYRAYVSPLIGEPHHPNCWGASWNWAVKWGLVQKIDGPSVNCSVNPKNHACTRPTYRWPDKGVQVDFKF
jgi:hypothetical protein